MITILAEWQVEWRWSSDFSLPAPLLSLSSVNKNMKISPAKKGEVKENMVSDLLEHKALRIPHCHVEVVIGASKLTTHSNSLRSCVT